MPHPPKELRHIHALVEIVSALRGPEGCPWDKEQTHQSLTQYAIEETFEMVEALESKDDAKFKDELGDVLFQVVLHAQLAKERGAFDLLDIIENLAEKLIRRHPHVFSDTQVQDTEEVIKNWETIKTKEKEGQKKPRLDVPAGMPALQRAYKIGKRTEKFKFDWSTPNEVFDKVEEEIQEFKEAIAQKNSKAMAHEMGDILFSLAQLSRHLGLEPEQILRQANQRFEKRFETMFQVKSLTDEQFAQLPAEEKEILWKEAKKRCHDME